MIILFMSPEERYFFVLAIENLQRKYYLADFKNSLKSYLIAE